MSSPENKILYTVGHSTHSLEEFIGMLQSFSIEKLIDVRRFHGSGKFPQFNKETLEQSLEKNGIEYAHFEALGGRRKTNPDSKNTIWRNDSFRGYADYMETPDSSMWRTNYSFARQHILSWRMAKIVLH